MAVQKADGSLFYAPDGTTATTGGDSKSALSNKSVSSRAMAPRAKLVLTSPPHSDSFTQGKPTAASKASAALNPPPPSVLLSHLLPLSASLPIVLMPGATDPASAALPQQGIHRAVLQGAGRWSGSTSAEAQSKNKDEAEDGAKAPREVRGGIELYNNPSWVQFGAKKILATSGQNLDDIMKYIPVRARGEAAGERSNGSAPQDDKMDIDSGEAAREDGGEDGRPDSANGASRPTGVGESQQESQGEQVEEEEEDERLTAAGRLLEFGHVAPTAPDTLCEYRETRR